MISMHKMQLVKEDPIYCILRCELTKLDSSVTKLEAIQCCQIGRSLTNFKSPFRLDPLQVVA